VVFVLTTLNIMRRLLAAYRKMSNVRSLLLLCIGVVSFYSPSTHAQIALAPLTGNEIQSALFGRLFTGEYPNGSQWAERFNPDFTTQYSEDGRVTKGTMSLNGNILCFTYADNDQSGGCFEVWKRGPNCFDFYSPTSDASLDQRRFGRAWQARGWDADQPSTCLSEEIS